jgi:hypothetical protein
MAILTPPHLQAQCHAPLSLQRQQLDRDAEILFAIRGYLAGPAPSHPGQYTASHRECAQRCTPGEQGDLENTLHLE